MKKVLKAVIVAALVAVGIVAIPTAAQADPLVGIHQAQVRCNSLGTPQSVTLTWRVAFNYYNSTLQRNEYDFQMLKAVFKGTTSTGGIQSKVTYGNASTVLWLSAAGGGANGPKIFPTGTANGPISTRENGVDVTWTTFRIVKSTRGDANENEMSVAFNNNDACKQFIDLSMPDRPQQEIPAQGEYNMLGTCDVGEEFFDEFQANWDIGRMLAANSTNYWFQMSAMNINRSDATGGSTASITAALVDAEGVEHDLTPPGGWTEGATSWPQVDFPVIEFPYYGGAPQFQPHLVIEFDHSGYTNNPFDVCTILWDLGSSWPTISNDTTDTIATFNDCSPGPATQPHGVVDVQMTWAYDSNNLKVKPKTLVIHNVSDAKLRWSNTSPSIVLSRDGGFTDISWWKNNYGTEIDRTIDPGATKTVPIDAEWAWTKLSTSMPYAAPTRQILPIDETPTMTVNLKAYKISDGTECTAAAADLDLLVSQAHGDL